MVFMLGKASGLIIRSRIEPGRAISNLHGENYTYITLVGPFKTELLEDKELCLMHYHGWHPVDFQCIHIEQDWTKLWETCFMY